MAGVHAEVKPDLAEAQIDLALLPAGLRLVVTTIGLPDAYHLLSQLGGTRLRLTRGLRLPRTLTELIGDAKARRLVDAWNRDRDPALRDEAPIITLPKVDKLLTQIRDEAIFAATEAGDTDAAIAIRWKVSERWVGKIKLHQSRKRSPHAMPRRQRDLFDAA